MGRTYSTRGKDEKVFRKSLSGNPKGRANCEQRREKQIKINLKEIVFAVCRKNLLGSG
jgi:hypothetical protein